MAGQYIGATHVEAYNPVRAPFSDSSRPNATQVDELIAEAEAEIELVLGAQGYGLPIPSTATGAFKLVQSACAKCAAALVEQVAPGASQDRIDHYVKMCESAKKMLADSPLPGVDKESTGSGSVGSGFSGASPMISLDMDL